MNLTPAQIVARRWGRPGDLPRTIPRNPTGSERQAGAPALSPAEWQTLRDWQRREIRRWTYEPAAIVRRKRDAAELAAGRTSSIQRPDDYHLAGLVPVPEAYESVDSASPIPLPAAA